MRWQQNIAVSILTRKTKNHLYEWVNDPDSIDDLTVLHVFGQQNPATGLVCATDYQRIPKRKAVQSMEIDRGQNVGNRGLNKTKSRIDFYLFPGQARIETEFPGHVHEVLLQNLQRYDPCPVLLVL